jgi:transposase, IS30 family
MARMRRLTFLERMVIEWALTKGRSHRSIAWTLGRDRRVIDREVERNKPEGRPYTARLAMQLTHRREDARCRRKLEKDEPLRAFVVKRLKEEFSPEQVAGLLKAQPPGDLQGRSVSHESIYQYIYQGEGRYGGLYKHLRRHQKRRKKRGARKHKKTHIQERISIHDRPVVIDRRQRLGDLECDLLESPRSDRHALSVHYERKSQFVKLHRVLDKTAWQTHEALLKTLDFFPTSFVKSVTFDNGPETSLHHVLRYEYDVETYHCDPYSSWQKGGVENINGLIRQYIPKGTKISSLTDEYIQFIEGRLNNRPRKKHNYKTPNQILDSVRGGALEP